MEQANELVKFGILGVFGHGLGHGAISKAMRDGITSELDSSSTALDAASELPALEAMYRLLPFILFWILLLKAALPNASSTVILSMTAVSTFFNTMTPQRLGFTYVQTVLLVAFSLNQLLRPVSEKNSVYALYPVIVALPVSAMAWIECTLCSKGVIGISGHLIYDACIPVSMIVFYATCWMMTKKQEKEKSV